MTDRLILGVDAGGSKTVAAAYCKDGTKLAQVTGGAGNVTVDTQAGCRALSDTVRALLAHPALQGRTTTLPYLCVGCAGVEASGLAPMVTAALLRSLSGQVGKIDVISDASLALYAAHGNADGILIISGTGSIGYRRDGDTLLRCGGWGHLLGDEGSGYDIVIRAFRAVTEAADAGLAAPQPLQDALLDAMGVDASQWVSHLYRSTKAQIAALFPAVAACAAQGDPLSRRLLTQAGEQLGALVSALLARQPSPTALPVACSGGILTKNSIVRAAFARAIRNLPITTIFDVDEPTRGAPARYFAISAQPSHHHTP